MKRIVFSMTIASTAISCPALLWTSCAANAKTNRRKGIPQATQEEAAEYAARGREVVGELAAKQFDKVYAQFDRKMAANTKLKLYPALNHLLIAGTGPSSPAEYTRLGHVSGEVVADVAAWIQQQTTGSSRS